MSTTSEILMLAAENDALPGAKVGGIGDVVRDVPPALAALGCRVTVLTPGYGTQSARPGAKRLASLEVGFGGGARHVELYQVPPRTPRDGVRHWVLEHPLFAACGRGRIYCDDPPSRPFARDASKFALFCAAAAEAVVQGHCGRPDIIHLHDWHAALFLLLRRYHPAYRALQLVRCVFSIHNLALQGVRPLNGDDSSLSAWFPGLHYQHSEVADPRWPDCVNPMAVGVRLADAVHAVSPTYAEEILRPSAVQNRGYYGGEGLENDLAEARAEGRLHGILNGCEYPDEQPAPPGWEELGELLVHQVLAWAGREAQLASSHFIAQSRLADWPSRRPAHIVTSIGRITAQKVRLLAQSGSDGRPALDAVLDTLGGDGLFILLGSGDAEYEQLLTETAGRRSNFLFLRGYSDALSQALYAVGDLFLMPSSFEPCGISQMLAMRAGQPCLVHHVGGLRDTVQAGIDGFAFDGASLVEQADHLVAALREALELHRSQPERWREIADHAAAARFLWADSAQAYLRQLYPTEP